MGMRGLYDVNESESTSQCLVASLLVVRRIGTGSPIIQCAVKPCCFGAGIEGARRQAKVFPCNAIPGSFRDKLTVCSLFDNRIYWRLSPAIVGGVKYIASSRPDVNRIRRTISLSNRRALGDRIGGFWLTLCE